MAKDFIPHLNRRSWMAGAFGLAGLAAQSASAQPMTSLESSTDLDWGIIEFDSPEEKFKQFVRMAYGLEERPFAYWAMLTYVYFKPDHAPVPIFAKEAMELSQAKKMAPNVWQVQGNNLSFPRDIETGEYITEFRNPLTGEMVPLPDAKVAVDDPGLIITPQGDRPIGRDMKPMPSEIVFRRQGDFVALHRIRPNPNQFGMVWPDEFIEFGTQTVSAADFYNPAINTLPGAASATFFLPAEQRWLPIDKAPNMAGGYIIVHVDSQKLSTVEELPKQFRDEAEARGYGRVLKLSPERFRKDLGTES